MIYLDECCQVLYVTVILLCFYTHWFILRIFVSVSVPTFSFSKASLFFVVMSPAECRKSLNHLCCSSLCACQILVWFQAKDRGSVAGCSVCKCLSKHLVHSNCWNCRTAQNVFQSICLVWQSTFFWVLLEFLVFHPVISYHVLPILLPEGRRCGEGKKFILYLVWTIYMFFYFLWMSTNFFFFLALPLDKAVSAFRGMSKSQFHSAYKSQPSWICNL